MKWCFTITRPLRKKLRAHTLLRYDPQCLHIGPRVKNQESGLGPLQKVRSGNCEPRKRTSFLQLQGCLLRRCDLRISVHT
uniref:Ovule protein n=1 Tax=Steinernema glaseri TaxID=37863 RepID=A0A1I7YP01_9BILA